MSSVLVQTKVVTGEEESFLHSQDERHWTMILLVVGVVVETMTKCRYLHLVLVSFLFFCYYYSPRFLFLLKDASYCNSLCLFS